MKKNISGLLSVGLLAVPMTVGSAPVTYQFSGTIVSIDDPSGALAGTVISTGAPFTGTFTYDPDEPATYTSDPFDDGVSSYSNWTDGSFGISANIAAAVVVSPIGYRSLSIFDGVVGSPYYPDVLSLTGRVAVAGLPALGVDTYASVWLQDNSASVFSSSATLPPSLNFGSFDQRSFHLNSSDGNGLYYTVDGQLTSLSEVKPVVVNGREWRQLIETMQISWDQLATVCDANTGACSGSLGAASFDGWTWASNPDVQALFDALIQPGVTNFPTAISTFNALDNADTDFAAVFDTVGFQPTLLAGNVRLIRGVTRSSADATLAYEPQLYDVLTGWGGTDGATLGNTRPKTIAAGWSGAWLYRDIYAGTLSLSLSASTQAGCKSVTGTLALSEPAPVGGVVVALSDTLANATTPAAVTIPEGVTTADFLIKTTPVSGQRSGAVTATLGSQTVTEPLTLRPMGLASLRLDPLRVVGSWPVEGQAQLECPAGPGPIVVNLESSEPTLANPVTPYLVIPQGVQSEQFTVTTNPVPSDATVQIVGAVNDSRRSRGLTLEPAITVDTTRLNFGKLTKISWSQPLRVTFTNEGAVAVRINNVAPYLPLGLFVYKGSSTCDWTPPGGSCSFSIQLWANHDAPVGKFEFAQETWTETWTGVRQEIFIRLTGKVVQ